MRKTSSPANWHASRVACLCASLKYAGTAITHCVTDSEQYDSALSFSFDIIIALISCGL